MKNTDIKIIEKNLNELDNGDDWVLINNKLYRYINCGRTIIHNHLYWLFKRIEAEGNISTYKETDSSLKIFSIRW